MKKPIEADLVKQIIQLPSDPQFKNMTGQSHNRLFVLDFAGRKKKQTYWLCRCKCGNEVTIRGAAIRNGNTKSCGCLSRERSSEAVRARNRRHGHRRTPEYTAWREMKSRCENPNHPAYHNYGGRNIGVCERWSLPNSFPKFLLDMGPRPSAKHSIERIDNSKGYSPENCCWAVWKDQVRNRRTNLVIEYNGRRMILADWAKETGLSRYCIADRIRKGWSAEKALTTPPQQAHRAGK